MQKPRYYGQWRTYLISGVLFASAAFLTLSFARGYHVDWSTGEVSKHGVVVLNSEPENAIITIDGERLGRQTNARVSLAAGTYDIKVEYGGAYPWEQRLVVDSGEALLYEHIALFAKQPVSKVLVTQPVTTFAVTPDRQHVAALTRESGGMGVWLGNPNGLRRLTLLPNTDPAGSSLVLSPDGSRVAVATAGQILIYGSSGGTSHVLTGTGLIGFAPGKTDTVVTNNQGAITTISDSTRTTVQPVATAILVVADAMYLALPNGSVERYDQHGRKTTLLPSGDQPVLQLIPAGSEVLVQHTNGTLRLVSKKGAQLIAGDVSMASATGSGNAVAYVSRRELRIWQQDTGQDRLVTRFSQDIGGVALTEDGHNAYYTLGAELHAIAEDGSNDLVLQQLSSPPIWTGSFELLMTSPEGVLRQIKLLSK